MIPSTSVAFVSQLSIDAKVVTSYGLKKQIEPVKNCRRVGKKDMKYNNTMPKMKVDPEKYVRRPFFFFFSFSSNKRRIYSLAFPRCAIVVLSSSIRKSSRRCCRCVLVPHSLAGISRSA